MKTLAQLKIAHDVIGTKRTAFINALRELGEHGEYEAEFMARAKLSPAQFGKLKVEFVDAHCVTPPYTKGHRKLIWCGTIKFARALRAALGVK